MKIHAAILVSATAIAVAACSGSNGSTPPLMPQPSTPRIASTVIGGDSDGLAVELLLAGERRDGVTWHLRQQPIADTGVGNALDAMAVDHVRSSVLGGGAGPTLLGSELVRRLATAPNAPPDTNNKNGNLDESLLAEAERVVAFAAAVPPAMNSLPLLPWRSRSAELAAPIDAADNASWQTRDLGDRVLDLGQLTRFLDLRITAARRLLVDRWRGRYGVDPDAGALGLLAMQQALAAEDTLFQAVFTDGGALRPLENPREYDPSTAARWLPRVAQADLDPAVAGAAAGFRTVDGASDLGTLGSMLRVAVDLSTLAEKDTPLAQPELFRNSPFRPPPNTPTPPSITWVREIRPLLVDRCGGCHLQQTQGGFSIATYESMRLGGNKTQQLNLQLISPGNSQGSLLHLILTGPPAPFVQMPAVGVILPAEIALIDAWIDEGALKDPPTPPAPPRPGDDMALVSFRNLVALHLDPITGGLHHRYESDGPSGIATALATGRALRGLAGFVRQQPATEFAGRTATIHLALAVGYAGTHLVDPEGRGLDAVELATGSPRGVADLEAQAALASGLLAAADVLGPSHGSHAVARRAASFLLSAFGDGEGNFGLTAGAAPSRYGAVVLTELLAALRFATDVGVADADRQRELLLRRLRPVLAFSEWDRDGEVFGDGIADTDGDGLLEPSSAGSEFGLLPLLTDGIVLDQNARPTPREPTWSRDVRPLLEQKCGECHLNGNQLGDYRLDTVRLVATPGESQGQFAMLVPGDPEASFFFRKIASRQPGLGSQMPLQRTPLDGLSVELVRAWIRSGASGR